MKNLENNEEKISQFTFTKIKVDWDSMGVTKDENNEGSYKGVGEGWIFYNEKIYINSSEYGNEDEFVQIVFYNDKNHTLDEIYDNFEPYSYCSGILFNMFGLYVEGFTIKPLSEEEVKSIYENPINVRYFLDIK